MGIPVISPIEVTIHHNEAALLLAGRTAVGEEHEPDYTVHELSPRALPAPDPAYMALDEIERACAISEYHDFEWWRTRIATVRGALGEHRRAV